jgi:hypothetical protein
VSCTIARIVPSAVAVLFLSLRIVGSWMSDPISASFQFRWP